MTDNMIKRGVALLIGLILLGSSIAGLLTSGERHYPHVRIEVSDPAGTVTMDFFIRPVVRLAQCEALIGNISRTMLEKCAICRISLLECRTGLDSAQEDYFSARPIVEVSAAMANGVMLFRAEDADMAINVCKEAGRQSLSGNHPMVCYPSGIPRPMLVRSWIERAADILDGISWWRVGLSLASLMVAAVFFCSCAVNLPPSQAARWAYRRIGQRLVSFPRVGKQAMLAVSDVLALWLALWMAFSLRLESLYVPQGEVVWLFLGLPLIAIPVFLPFGLYRAVIRFLGGQAVRTVAMAVASHSVLFALLVVLSGVSGVPRSVLVIYPLLAVLLVGMPRYVARVWLGSVQHHADGHRERVLIYGAGSAGMQLSSALMHSRELRPVGFVDDDSSLAGNTINGLPVFASEQLEQAVSSLAALEILLAIPSASRMRRNEIMQQLEKLSVHVRTLPGLSDLAQGKVKIDDLREVDIEDLLGRDPISPDRKLLGATIAGHVVLVSGAGGSIGSELCRQIIRLHPAAVVLFEHSEYSLYAIEQELLRFALPTPVPVYPVLGSVTDQPLLKRTLLRYGVQTVFHAAAYKHVPMVERNPIQGVANNIFGTFHSARAALDAGVKTFVLISTDKAVRPTNTMGTTKRFAEMILQGLHATYPDRTRFTMVRFGNVLGSSGSVVPLFREQIRRGGPVTVTDPRIIRYFMTIPEAAQLVIQAGAMGSGQDVFVLDMGEPVKILDLALRMIHLSGLRYRDDENPDGEIEIVYTGLRPGEKLYEELLIGDNVTATSHPRIMRADEKCLPWSEVENCLTQLHSACESGDSDAVRRILLAAVEEFSPQCGNQDLLCG